MCNGSVTEKGEPRIVDRCGRGLLSIGIESFEDVLRGFTYVDKSLAAGELVDRRGVTLYCRPRRFGKSTFLRMLQCFFECPAEGFVPDRRGLFDGLAISEADPRYMVECCAHPVVYLNLASCGADNLEDTTAKMAHAIADEYVRHAYLLESPKLMSFQKARFERVAAEEARPQELVASLSTLCKLLSRHHGSQVVVLIDEYDTPVSDAHLHGFRHRVLDFYRSWLSDALKGTVDLYCAALTGVLRVSQESIFSELNNVQIDTTLDDDRAEVIGFTAAEVEVLAAHVGREDKLAEMAEWYDGYRFGETDVYNPWSVLNYLRKGRAQPYWTNTSSNGIVSDLIRRAGEKQTAELATLAGGGEVAKPLDLRTVFDDFADNPEAVWAQLYQAGYVTTSDTGAPNDDQMERGLRIPNHEVRLLYGKELLARATRLAGSGERLSALHRAVTSADAPTVAEVLRRILLDSASYHDLSSEAGYHVLLLALLYAVPGYRPATSERESGDGRCDVLLEPVPAEAGRLPAHAMELKLDKAAATDETLVTCARDVALAQARRLGYGHGLSGSGLVRWGVAFCGKRVAVACEHESGDRSLDS
jgi:hypothetical protein